MMRLWVILAVVLGLLFLVGGIFIFTSIPPPPERLFSDAESCEELYEMFIAYPDSADGSKPEGVGAAYRAEFRRLGCEL